MTTDVKNKREFLLLMDRAQMTQTRLASLLGVYDMTVNRWCSEREDAVDPPYYALSFLRIYMMLPEAARGRIPTRKMGRPVKGNPAKTG